MPLIPVGDPADPRLEPFRDVRERDLVGRRGLFLAEGETVVRQMLRAGRCPLEALLVTERKAARFADLLAADPALPVMAAPQGVFDAVAGFPVHRGVLGLGRRPSDPGAEALLAAAPERALVLVALGIGDHDNLGALFRNAAAFGACAVLLGADACDPLYRKAIRVSVGAALTTPFSRLPPGVDLPVLLAAHGFEALALTPAGAEPLRTLARPPRAALIVGAEGPGLPADLLARCRTVAIPMAGGFDSLNVATSAAVALHHLSQPGEAASGGAEPTP